MQTLTTPSPAQIPHVILSQYDAAAKGERLTGLLLYPPGAAIITLIFEYPQLTESCSLSGVLVADNEVLPRLCSECHTYIINGNLQRLAIANGNWIGSYPNDELPWIEEQLVALVSPCVSIKTVTGGSQRCLRSHHYIVKNTAGPILEMLQDQAASRVHVTMVRAMTPQQVAIDKALKTEKKHEKQRGLLINRESGVGQMRV
jgi:hypothetical protein